MRNQLVAIAPAAAAFLAHIAGVAVSIAVFPILVLA